MITFFQLVLRERSGPRVETVQAGHLFHFEQTPLISGQFPAISFRLPPPSVTGNLIKRADK